MNGSNTSTTPLPSNETTFGHPLGPTASYIISTYFIILMFCAMLFNGLLIYAVLRYKRLHNTTNALIVNMTVGNLLVAISILPFETSYIIVGHYDSGRFLCGLKETMFMFSLPSSIVNLFLMTFERLVKILLPYKYEEFFSRRRLILIIMSTWAYTITVALFPFFLSEEVVCVYRGKCMLNFPMEYAIFQAIGNFFIPLVGIVGMNVQIFLIAQKHYKDILKQTHHLTVGHNTRQKSKHFTANFKAAKTIMMLVGIFLVCWLFLILVIVGNITCGELCVPRLIMWLSNAVNYSSIAINPLLYGLRNADVRRVLWRKYAVYCCYRGDGGSSMREGTTQYLRSPSPCASPNLSMTPLTSTTDDTVNNR